MASKRPKNQAAGPRDAQYPDWCAALNSGPHRKARNTLDDPNKKTYLVGQGCRPCNRGNKECTTSTKYTTCARCLAVGGSGILCRMRTEGEEPAHWRKGPIDETILPANRASQWKEWEGKPGGNSRGPNPGYNATLEARLSALERQMAAGGAFQTRATTSYGAATQAADINRSGGAYGDFDPDPQFDAMDTTDDVDNAVPSQQRRRLRRPFSHFFEDPMTVPGNPMAQNGEPQRSAQHTSDDVSTESRGYLSIARPAQATRSAPIVSPRQTQSPTVDAQMLMYQIAEMGSHVAQLGREVELLRHDNAQMRHQLAEVLGTDHGMGEGDGSTVAEEEDLYSAAY